MFVSRRDEFEENTGFGLILGDIGKIVEDQQVELVELCKGGLELQLPPCELQLLNQVGSPGEEDAPAVLDQCQANGGREMILYR